MDRKNLKNDIECLIRGIINGDVQTYLDTVNRVDRITKLGNLPTKLTHYLSRRSYVKALDFLNALD